MLIRVTEDGFVVPKHLLPGVDQVEVRVENGIVMVVPADSAEAAEDDPVYRWGTAPVRTGITDGSVDHDKYIYDLRE